MGGRAFLEPGPNGEPALNVPRMSVAVYNIMKTIVQQKLEKLYDRACVPREAPGKPDFGDIDFAVQGPRNPCTSAKEISEELGAVRFISYGHVTSYAIKHPLEPDAYIQVDISNFDLDVWDWNLFLNSDSDLNQMLGILHRDVGFTLNDKGLYLRIEEIEPLHKKNSLVYLSHDVKEVFTFLRLDYDTYTKGYKDRDEIFEWLAKSRFFNRAIFEDRVRSGNEKRRLETRPMYRQFITEWLPAHPEAGNNPKVPNYRKQALEAALLYFNRTDEYRERMRAHQLTVREKNLIAAIEARIPLETKGKKTVVRGFKYWLDLKDRKLVFRSDPVVAGPDGQAAWLTTICEDDTLFASDDSLLEKSKEAKTVLDWLERNWMKAKELEKIRISTYKANIEA